MSDKGATPEADLPSCDNFAFTLAIKKHLLLAGCFDSYRGRKQVATLGMGSDWLSTLIKAVYNYRMVAKGDDLSYIHLLSLFLSYQPYTLHISLLLVRLYTIVTQ